MKRIFILMISATCLADEENPTNSRISAYSNIIDGSWKIERVEEIIDPELLTHTSPGYEDRWQIERLESLDGESALKLMYLAYGSDPKQAFIRKAFLHFARNPEVSAALEKRIAEIPVLYENQFEREKYFRILASTRAEWAVRLLLKLMDDERPLTSELEELQPPPPGTTRIFPGKGLAMSLLDRGSCNSMVATDTFYSLLIDINMLKEYGSRWNARDKIRDPAFREQIPDILFSSWGGKGVMNSDIGLGPDNRPLAKRPAGDSVHPGSSRRPPPRGMAGVTDAPAPAPGRTFPWLLLGGSLLVLAAAAAMAAKRRSGTSAPGPPRRPG